MRLLRYATVLMSLTVFSATAAEPFEAGRDYIVLDRPQPVETGDKIEVREFFWYGCPHCYMLEAPLAAYVKKRMPANAKFVRTPGVARHWLIHAQTYFAFEALGVTEKLHGPFFDAWHVQKRPLNSEAAIASFVQDHGVSADKFRGAFNSFGVRARLEKAIQQNIAFMIDSVPTLVIDGRYRTSPDMAGGKEPDEAKRAERTMKVVDFLIKKAAEDRKKAAR